MATGFVKHLSTGDAKEHFPIRVGSHVVAACNPTMDLVEMAIDRAPGIYGPRRCLRFACRWRWHPEDRDRINENSRRLAAEYRARAAQRR